MSTSSLTRLYQVDECPDLYVDACASRRAAQLSVLSAWGRDTALQEFLARLTLGSAENGLDQFHIVSDGRSLPVFPNVDLLENEPPGNFAGRYSAA